MTHKQNKNPEITALGLITIFSQCLSFMFNLWNKCSHLINDKPGFGKKNCSNF